MDHITNEEFFYIMELTINNWTKNPNISVQDKQRAINKMWIAIDKTLGPKRSEDAVVSQAELKAFTVTAFKLWNDIFDPKTWMPHKHIIEDFMRAFYTFDAIEIDDSPVVRKSVVSQVSTLAPISKSSVSPDKSSQHSRAESKK